MTDTIADMLTRIRNASLSGNTFARVPLTKLTERITEILYAEGFILSYERFYLGVKGLPRQVDSASPRRGQVLPSFGAKGFLMLRMKYVLVNSVREPFIGGIHRVSKSSRRVYIKARDLSDSSEQRGLRKEVGSRKSVGLGRQVLSTSKGIITDKEALTAGVGGEVLFSIYSRY